MIAFVYMNERKNAAFNNVAAEKPPEPVLEEIVGLLAKYEENAGWVEEDITAILYELKSDTARKNHMSHGEALERLESLSTKLRAMDRAVIRDIFEVVGTRVVTRLMNK